MSRVSDAEVFVHVVRDGGFTAAARALGVSKSWTSRVVAGLEERLGARLLARTTRQLSLTEAGKLFYDRSTAALDSLQEAEAAVNELQTSVRGTLRITVPMSFGLLYVADALAEFMTRHPDLAVDCSYTDRVVDIVEEGYHLAVRGGDLADTTLRARRLLRFNMALVASPAYLAAHGAPETPEDLADRPCLLYAGVRSPNLWAFETADGREARVRVKGPLLSNNGDALTAAACAGLGFAYQPSWMVDDPLRDGRLAFVLPDWWGRQGAMWAVYPPTRHLATKVRLFIDFLAERLAPLEQHLTCPEDKGSTGLPSPGRAS